MSHNLATMWELIERTWMRHRWSLPLGGLATVAFVRLAVQVGRHQLDGFDRGIAEFVTRGRGHYDALMFGFTQLGEWKVTTPLVLGTMTWLGLRGHKRDAWFVAISAGGCALLNTGLKLLFQRARPEQTLTYLLGPAPSFSFPSGHAMCSLGVFATLLIVLKARGFAPGFRWPLNLLVGACLIGVATSRVYFGMHYPSDVIGGQLAGAAWVALITGWFYPRLLPGEAVTPEHTASPPT